MFDVFFFIIVWLCLAFAFEVAFDALTRSGYTKIQKPHAVKIWWILIGLLSLRSVLGGLLPALTAFPIVLCHLRMSHRTNSPTDPMIFLTSMWTEAKALFDVVRRRLIKR